MRWTLLILLIFLQGCSWIAVDRYFKNDGNSEVWASKFREGKTSTKTGGYPDTFVHTYHHSKFSVAIDISYQNVLFVGPLVFPIIPTPWKHSGDLIIEVRLNSIEEMTVDINKWILVADGVRYLPKSILYSDVGLKTMKTLVPKGSSRTLVSYPLKVADLDAMSLSVGSIQLTGLPINIPNLDLVKQAGTWHFEQFTF
jgi:hypothetical protein